MGCSLFANYHFQMGVTAMGFAEDFGLSVLVCDQNSSTIYPLCLYLMFTYCIFLQNILEQYSSILNRIHFHFCVMLLVQQDWVRKENVIHRIR